MLNNKKLVTDYHLTDKAIEVMSYTISKALPDIAPDASRILAIAILCSFKADGIHLSLTPFQETVCEV